MAKKNEAAAVNTEVNVVLKKRGRKSKKELESALQAQIADNINVTIEDTAEAHSCECLSAEMENSAAGPTFSSAANTNTITTNNTITLTTNDVITITNDVNITEADADEETKPIAKKRGRKPKGGKIIQQVTPLTNAAESKPNVILHLKCSVKDLQTAIGGGNDIQSFDIQNSAHLTFDIIDPDAGIFDQHVLANNDILSTQQKLVEDDLDYDDNRVVKETDGKEVWRKLKVLEHILHVNNICDKKSACFWCTYEFDNPPVYITKYLIKYSYQV